MFVVKFTINECFKLINLYVINIKNNETSSMF